MKVFQFETIESAFDMAREANKPVYGLFDRCVKVFYPSGYSRSIPASFPLALINPRSKDQQIINSWEGLGK